MHPEAREFHLSTGVTLRGVAWAADDSGGQSVVGSMGPSVVGSRGPSAVGATNSSTDVSLVLVHGLASNARLWDGAARHLAAMGYSSIAIDQRGHGLSDKPDSGYDMATVVDDLAALLERLATTGAQRPIVLGQSWGGNVVVELAARYPHLVRGVVGVDGGTIELSRTFPKWAECERLLAPPNLLGTAASALRERMCQFHPDWSSEAIDGAMANMEILADGTVRPWLARDRHMAVLRGLWEHLPSACFPTITVPVMFVSAAGHHDDAATVAKRSAVDAAMTSLRHGRSVWFSPADHDLHAQQPLAFAECIHTAITEGFFS